MSDVTFTLRAIERGERAASEHLLPLIYHELRKFAAAALHRFLHALQGTIWHGGFAQPPPSAPIVTLRSGSLRGLVGRDAATRNSNS
jgi:methionine salvage enolase-phosphatase E1